LSANPCRELLAGELCPQSSKQFKAKMFQPGDSAAAAFDNLPISEKGHDA
jgi:hypothetical protein